ncbi:hypothetical protein J1614_009661 [Plenodomus biglobosus]|nr:hypothetical protein J1614_009661 [Plenodomus biglobosus]
MSTTALSDSRATWTYEPTLANAEVYLRSMPTNRAVKPASDIDHRIKQIDQERKMLRDQELQSLQMVHEERRKLVRTRQKPSKKRQTLCKQLATLDVEHTEIVRFVAEQSCRNFAEKFYTKLPAELREMVYGFLWTHNMLMDIRGDRAVYNVTTGLPLALSPARFKFGRRGMEEDCTPATLPCAGQPCDCFKWSDLPVGMRHQYVGTDVAKEVIAAYYRAIPSEQFSTQLDRLKDCLLMDHFHLGVIPADHIRRIELELNESDSMNTASYPPRPSGQVAIQSLRQNLEALRAVRSKSALKLKVCIISPRS